MSDNLGNAAGNKLNLAREVDIQNVGDLLGLTNAQLADVIFASAKSAVDLDGNKRIVWTIIYNKSTITLTDFANAGVGSRIYAVGLSTKTLYVKCAESSPAVVGDWYLEALSQAT
jgi:hypothetical protein